MLHAEDISARQAAEARVSEIFRPAREMLAEALRDIEAARERVARELQDYGRQ